jgi:hypothetical protein
MSALQNDQIIYDIAIKNGFTTTAAKLVVAQARFESADYTSAVFKANLNTSGMKYIGQPLATRGTLAPYNERSSTCQRGATCVNSDHYAKFASVSDSAKDKIERLFTKTMGGVVPAQIKNAQTPEEFAELMKRRSYYGFHKYGTSGAQAEMNNYSRGMKAKLIYIQVQEFVVKNKKSIAGTLVGIALLLGAYFVYKNRNRIKIIT